MHRPRLRHLAGRFFTSLRPGGPGADSETWARSHLLPAEEELWERMGSPDRRHAVRVARRVEATLGDEASRPVMAAALLHDVGKTVAHLGTYGRVVATLSRSVAGAETAAAWVQGRGITRRVGLHLTYPRLGADLLELAGSDPLTVAWALEHHLPPEEWTVPSTIGRALAAADE